MNPLDVFLILTAGAICAGTLESIIHRYRLSKVPIRIHISGTRGKSSVTRLLAAGFSNSGISCAAKTTGTLARMILPDKREIPVFRPVGANILEQMRIVTAASELRVKALLVECMALQPELHWISENKFIRATHGVITNIRPDHLDVMGPTTADVAKAISSMIPINGKLYTTEGKYDTFLKSASEDRKTEFIKITEDEIQSVTDEELSGFKYTEHKDNIALCLRILSDFGIDRRIAIKAMWNVQADPGVLTEHKLNFFGRKIIFVNAFAANDPESTEKIWTMMMNKYAENVNNVITVFNLREDRPHRTVQYVNNCSFWKDSDKVVLMGSGSYLFARLAAKNTNYPVSGFVYTENDAVEDIFEKIIDLCGSSALIFGVGNIGGLGLPLARYFKNREFLGEV